MSRVIKFRAWDKHHRRGGMGNVVEINWSKDECIVGFGNPGQDDHVQGWGGYASHGFLLSEVELMQFTGLQDKNGKEVYEGDIVRAETYTIQGGKHKGTKRVEIVLVQYVDGILAPFHDFVPDNEYWMHAFPAFEVIGNLYENTELLEVQS